MFLYRGTPMNQRSQQDMQKKLCTRISNSFSLSIIFMWTTGFYRFEHVYIQKRHESQNIIKKKYVIALDSYYLLIKKSLNMELNVMLIVLMEFAFLKHSMNALHFKQIMNLTVC